MTETYRRQQQFRQSADWMVDSDGRPLGLVGPGGVGTDEGELGGGETVVLRTPAAGLVGALPAGAGAVVRAATGAVAPDEDVTAAFAGITIRGELHGEHRTQGV